MKDRIVAAIDIGTNSIHMVVVQINHLLPSFSIIATEKETVRLGERCTATGRLTEAAMERALQALQRCRELCRTLGVEAIVAAATSATRESPNGLEFIDRIFTTTGIQVNLISGQEEARLIYLGVLSAMELDHYPHVIMDIGGGSTELILGDGHEPGYLSSSKVGAVRLTEMMITTDPISSQEYQQLQIYIRGVLERPIEELQSILGKNPFRLIGTSGTIEAVLSLYAKETSGIVPNPLHGYTVSLAGVTQVVDQLRHSTLADRIALVKEKRAEILLAGSMILLEVMEALGVEEITFCQRALREGLIVDWMLRNGLIEDRLRYQRSVRERSVLKLAEKYRVNLKYSRQVAHLALSLFDQSKGILHHWGESERDLLWAAAILHNAGHFVSHAEHHKHSYYLIRHGELLGYTETEVEAIANLARYHRKSEPKKKHENYRNLSHTDRLFVDQICPLLRLAVALDRRQLGAIQNIHLQIDMIRRRCSLQITPVHPEDPCALELWSLEYKKSLFESFYNMPLTVTVARNCEPVAPASLPR